MCGVLAAASSVVKGIPRDGNSDNEPKDTLVESNCSIVGSGGVVEGCV